MLMFKKNLILGKGVHAFKNKFVVIRGIHKKDLIVSHSVVVRCDGQSTFRYLWKTNKEQGEGYVV